MAGAFSSAFSSAFDVGAAASAKPLHWWLDWVKTGMFKNVASQKLTLLAIDTSTGAPKTGDSANITAYVSKDDGVVTVLGDATATELDATNAPGLYAFDLTQGETNADKLVFSGKSSTANIKIVPMTVYTMPNRFTTLVIDAAGLADANTVKVGPTGSGTAQTAGDLAALINTVDDLLDTEVAAIKAKTDNLPSDPADASDVAAAFSTVNSTLATIAGYLDTEIAAIKAKTDNLPSDPADASDIAASFSSLASTLSTIAGYLDTEVAAIKAKTDNLPSDPADASDIAASFSTVNSTLSTLAGYIDTEVAAIKAKTDNLPTDPADQSALEAAITAAQSALTTLINAVDDFLDTEVAAIKAVTDNLSAMLPTSAYLAGSENEDGSIAVDVGDIDLDIDIHPYSTSAPQRVIGTRITLFEDEAGFWVPMTSYNADRTALNLSGKQLQLIIEDNDENVLATLAEGSGVLEVVSAAAGTWRFKATDDMCPAIAENKKANWWTLSDVTSGVSEVLAWGRLWVQRRAGH